MADRHWHHYRAGQGAKGPHWYAWAWARIDESQAQRYRWLLIRRNLTTGELAFYRCYAPTPTPLTALIATAGTRWAIEESFQAAKDQAGLDHYQVRGWTAWYRHITLAMLALALPAAIAAAQPARPDDRIPLTLPEARRLLTALILTTAHTVTDILRWSDWRRRHQATARRCHYQRRSPP